jgi:ParB/RepB/Spo0J family partition protein
MGKNAAKAVGAAGRIDAHMMDPHTLTIIEDDPKSPLYDGFGKGKGIAEDTVLNIMEHGILQPILARRAGAKDGVPIIEVIAGRDRVRAVRIANERLAKSGSALLKVPVIFKRGDDKKLFGMVLSENVHRKALSPLYKARQMQRYLDMGATEADVMRDLHISTATVRNYKALLECTTKVQKLVDTDQVSTEAAIELSKLPHAEQDAKVDEMMASGATKGIKALEAVKEAKAGRPAKPQSTSKTRSRSFAEKAVAALRKKDSASATMVAEVFSFIYGNDAALKKLPLVVQDVLKQIL